MRICWTYQSLPSSPSPDTELHLAPNPSILTWFTDYKANVTLQRNAQNDQNDWPDLKADTSKGPKVVKGTGTAFPGSRESAMP